MMHHPSVPPNQRPLDGLRVVDASTLFAGPTAATLLADYGADVVKVEHPAGDGQRRMGWQKDGTSLLWTVTNRNKRGVTLDLHKKSAQRLFRDLVQSADVLIENFRPGTLDRWGVSTESLSRDNPGLVILRVTAYGQTGPWSSRPGFGTIAEAMSGFAQINGHPDGPPTLPPFALGDAIAGVIGASAVLAALRVRDTTGKGQELDLSIFEPLFWILGPQLAVYQHLGEVQSRSGNRAPFTSPRNMYESSDGKWIALSASTQSVAERLMRMVGHPELIAEPWFENHVGRLAHQDELDSIIGAWVAQRTADEVLRLAGEYDVAMGQSLTIEEMATHEQYLARESFVTLKDDKGDGVLIQNVVPKFGASDVSHRNLAPGLGEHNLEIFEELGYTLAQLSDLRREGAI
jgi:formyl-CoA transferase